MKKTTAFLCCLLLVSCATTEIRDNWKDPSLSKSYHHPLIIGRSDSQLTRRIYEDYLGNLLKKRKIEAIPSYTLISSKQKINKETVAQTIRESNQAIDSVLVTYLVSADTELVSSDSPLGDSYSGSLDDNTMSSTLITNRRINSKQLIVLKTDLYDVSTGTIVWSAITESDSPESIDEVIVEVSHELDRQLLEDGVFK